MPYRHVKFIIWSPKTLPLIFLLAQIAPSVAVNNSANFNSSTSSLPGNGPVQSSFSSSTGSLPSNGPVQPSFSSSMNSFPTGATASFNSSTSSLPGASTSISSGFDGNLEIS